MAETLQEARQRKLDRLATLRTVLENKQGVAEDFKQKHNINFEVLFNPKHPSFGDHYALEDD